MLALALAFAVAAGTGAADPDTRWDRSFQKCASRYGVSDGDVNRQFKKCERQFPKLNQEDGARRDACMKPIREKAARYYNKCMDEADKLVP